MKYLALLLVWLLSFQFVFSQNILKQSKAINDNEEYYKTTIQANLSLQDKITLQQDYWDKLLNMKRFLENPFQADLQPVDVNEIDAILLFVEEQKKHLLQTENLGKAKSNYAGDDTDLTDIPITSGINFTTRLINGTSALIVSKVKKELSITFYEKLTEKLRKSFAFDFNGKPITFSYQDLLPNTYTLIDTKQSFEIPAFGATWTAAFENDLKQIPFSMIGVFKKDSTYLKNDLGRYAVILTDGLDQLKKGYSTNVVIENLTTKYNKISTQNIDYQIALLYLILQNSEGMVQETSKNFDLTDYRLSQNGRKYFVGLFYLNGLQMGIDISHKFNINENNYNAYYELIKDTQISLKNLSNATQQLKISDEKTASDFTKFAGLFTDVINGVLENDFNINHNDNTVFYDSEYYKKYIPLTKNIISFYDGLDHNNYGSTVLSTINFLNLISPNTKNTKFISDYTFYTNFLVDMVAASTNENADIENILNKYAMPVTSYRIKRHYKYSVDISAYPGINVGYEFSESNSPSFGISAPIGFTFSWRSKKSTEEYAPSQSIFISGIDIGAPISYRLSEDASNGLPENIQWKQLFSPGIYYIYGFRKSPICVSAGVQFSPLLRKIETQNVLSETNVFKAGVALWVDLPLFSLYKKPKNVED